MLGRVSPVTRVTFPACRAHYPGGPQRVHLSVASPPRAAFPEIQAGRRPRRLFRGLLRLHSRYGPSDRSTAQGGLCHEASTRLVAQTGRSSATRSTDNSLGGTFLHWWRAPSGRTEFSGLGAEPRRDAAHNRRRGFPNLALPPVLDIECAARRSGGRPGAGLGARSPR